VTADALTKPERTCSRAQARSIRAHVLDDGGCCYCTHRSSVLNTIGRRAACGLEPPKQFPLCTALAGGFDFDEQAYREGAGRDMGDRDARD